jgi:hypothetical protein
MASYLTVSDADALAATILSSLVSAYLAASSGDKAKALEVATADVDRAGPYQGRKADPPPTGTQTLEFPRLVYGGRGDPRYTPGGTQYFGDTYWDWDYTNNVAVVPGAVKLATLYQANAILGGTETARIEAARSRLTGQSVGGMSESYGQPMSSGGTGQISAFDMLTARAQNEMRQYLLKGGQLL